MFKKSILFFILLISLNCFADALILVPIQAHLNENDSIELGNAMPGQTLKLIISDNSFREDGLLWEKAELILPKNWELIFSGKDDKSIEALIKIPELISPNIYNLKLILSSPSTSIESEKFNLKVVVLNEALISVASNKLFVDGKTGQKSNYSLIISNNSICSQKLLVKSSLPETWFESFEIIVPNNSVKEISVNVIPQKTGRKEFSFIFMDSKKLASLNAVINSKPSLQGKFYSFIAGFPVYSFSLIPFNLINSLIGFFLM